jgi:hypothetical protein
MQSSEAPATEDRTLIGIARRFQRLLLYFIFIASIIILLFGGGVLFGLSRFGLACMQDEIRAILEGRGLVVLETLGAGSFGAHARNTRLWGQLNFSSIQLKSSRAQASVFLRHGLQGACRRRGAASREGVAVPIGRSRSGYGPRRVCVVFAFGYCGARRP